MKSFMLTLLGLCVASPVWAQESPTESEDTVAESVQ